MVREINDAGCKKPQDDLAPVTAPWPRTHIISSHLHGTPPYAEGLTFECSEDDPCPGLPKAGARNSGSVDPHGFTGHRHMPIT